MRVEELGREHDEVRPFDVPRRPVVPYYLDEEPPGPPGFDPHWDLLDPWDGGWSTGAMHFGYQGQPITMRQWVALRQADEYRLKRTPIVGIREIAEVSTVWLGLNHRYYGDGDPLIFESMVFGGGELDQDFMRRYTSWHEALAGHAEIVQLVELELVELAAGGGEGRHALDDVARELGVDLDDGGDE